MHTNTRTNTLEFSFQIPYDRECIFRHTLLEQLRVISACPPLMKSPTVITLQVWGWGWVGVPVAPSSHPAVSASSMFGLVRTADQNQGEGC